MGVVTTTSLGAYRPGPPCYRCGWSSGLMTYDPSGRRVHALDECPEGEAPVETENPIAHDPLSDEMGTTVPILQHLKDIGHGLTRVSAESGDVFERVDLEKAKQEMERSRFSGPALPPKLGTEEDLWAGRGVGLPLTPARRKRPTTPPI